MENNEINAWASMTAMQTREQGEFYLKLGRRYYFLSYFLTVTAVAASLAAGAAAMWQEVGQSIVGALALIPAFAVTVASRLKLVEKGNWFYATSDKLVALARKIEVEALQVLTMDDARQYVSALNAINQNSSATWVEALAFEFDNSTTSPVEGSSVNSNPSIEGPTMKSGSGG